MFCHKCGTKMPEESTFCFKCGTKLISEDISNPIEATDTEAETVSLNKSPDSEVQQPIQTPTPESSHTEQNNNDAEFRRFVNKRVQEMTKCKTAEELMKKTSDAYSNDIMLRIMYFTWAESFKWIKLYRYFNWLHTVLPCSRIFDLLFNRLDTDAAVSFQTP